jgi:hypothetical protein
MLNIVMLSVVRLNVIMLSVVEPILRNFSELFCKFADFFVIFHNFV